MLSNSGSYTSQHLEGQWFPNPDLIELKVKPFYCPIILKNHPETSLGDKMHSLHLHKIFLHFHG